MKEFVQTKKIKILLSIIGGLILLLMVYQAGVFVGYRRASFSYGLGDNYYKALGGGRHNPQKFMGSFPMGGFPDSHGTIGKVVSINLPTLVVQDRDGVEKIIRVNEDTVFMNMREKVGVEMIKADNLIAVIGSPNDQSEIVAKLIRIVPAPPEVNDEGINNIDTNNKN